MANTRNKRRGPPPPSLIQLAPIRARLLLGSIFFPAIISWLLFACYSLAPNQMYETISPIAPLLSSIVDRLAQLDTDAASGGVLARRALYSDMRLQLDNLVISLGCLVVLLQIVVPFLVFPIYRDHVSAYNKWRTGMTIKESFEQQFSLWILSSVVAAGSITDLLFGGNLLHFFEFDFDDRPRTAANAILHVSGVFTLLSMSILVALTLGLRRVFARDSQVS